MGLDREMFQSLDAIEDYICYVCSEVVSEAVECSGYGQYFCSSCIKPQQQCPKCKEHCHFTRIRKKQEDKLLNQNVLCKWCKVQMTLSAYLQHVSQCDKVICRHSGCGISLTHSDISIHESSCQHRLLSCPNNGCNQILQEYTLPMHKNHCSFALRQCENPGCGALISRIDYSAHISKCQFREILCNNCPNKLAKKDIENHKITCAKGYGLNQLYVHGLPSYFTQRDLANYFLHFGELQETVTRKDGKGRTYGFVTYKSVVDAQQAKEHLQNAEIDGNTIYISWRESKSSYRTRYPCERNIFVGNLDPCIDQIQLTNLFKPFGIIFQVKICNSAKEYASPPPQSPPNSNQNEEDPDQDKSKHTFAFVCYEKEESALRAIDNMNGKRVGKYIIYVQPYQNREQRKTAFHSNIPSSQETETPESKQHSNETKVTKSDEQKVPASTPGKGSSKAVHFTKCSEDSRIHKYSLRGNNCIVYLGFDEILGKSKEEQYWTILNKYQQLVLSMYNHFDTAKKVTKELLKLGINKNLAMWMDQEEFEKEVKNAAQVVLQTDSL